jgi:hypothetical protein
LAFDYPVRSGATLAIYVDGDLDASGTTNL